MINIEDLYNEWMINERWWFDKDINNDKYIV